MAKIRVYELSRELNMKNKALMDKIREMEIPINSHMSALEDHDVERIRTNVLGKSADEVEVTRVKSTVIRRRRRKPAAEAPAETEAEAGLETATQTEGPATESIIEQPPDTEIEKEDETSLPETMESEESTSLAGAGVDLPDEAETGVHEPADKSLHPAKPAANEDHAVVIQRPEPVEPEADREVSADSATEAVTTEDDTTEVVPSEFETETPAAPEPETSSTEDAAAPVEPEALETHPGTDTETAAPPEVTETGEEQEVPKDVSAPPKPEEKAPVTETAETPAEKPAKPTKGRKRKSKRETPAKIIKLPEKPPEEPMSPSQETPEQPATPSKTAKSAKMVKPAKSAKPAKTPKVAADQQAPPPEAETAKGERTRKKRGGEDVGDDKFFKKRISFQKKEVVEGSALYAEGSRSRKGRRGGKGKPAQPMKTQITTPKAIKRRIKIDESIALSDLAKRMGIKVNEMIVKLMGMGIMATVNQTIDFDTATIVAGEFGYEVEKAAFEEEAVIQAHKEPDEPEKLQPRPPVVTIMGHVDHGKTSLLDVIRETRITDTEAGGITQHIGAYYVEMDSGQISFLDTPGHEAFTAMRARGAMVTDIVILVVAADDGVMPQTIEAVNHSKAAGVPIIVAVNKMDRPDANPDRVMRQLAEQDLVPEPWGGDTIFVNVSAKEKTGINDLLEMILLQSEVLELRANPEKPAVGYVVEARLDQGRGAVATVLVQDGTLRAGQPVVCGVHYGKIRAMVNDRGEMVEEAGPSFPVEILGLGGVPNAGDELIALTDDKSAKQVSQHRSQKQRSVDLAKTNRLSLDQLFERMQEGETKDLNLIVKGDVQGSIEALEDSLVKLSNEEVTINVVHSGTGTITETDVSLAAVSDAIIIGFNVRAGAKVTALAAEEHVDIRYYDIIYNVIKDIKDAITGMMSSKFEERILGRVEVREVFQVPKVGTVAGSYITDGKVRKGEHVRLLRDGVVTYDGKIASLRRFKDDVKEVTHGYECGIGIEHFNDIKVGDTMEVYYLEEIKPEI